MNKSLRDASFPTCPSCGSLLKHGALTCSCCGGVIAVENVLGRLRSEFMYQTNRISQYLQDRNVLIWALALCPIFILPPVLALLMSLRWFRFSGPEQRSATHNLDVIAIPVLAICNVVLSVIFWRWLSEISIASGFSIGQFLKSIGIDPPRSSPQAI
jgi:hypothetical protein